MTKAKLLQDIQLGMTQLKQSSNWSAIEKQQQAFLAPIKNQQVDITEDLLKDVYTALTGLAPTYRTKDEVSGRKVPVAAEVNHFMTHYISQMQLSKKMFDGIEYAGICHKRFLEICPFEKANMEVAQWLLNYLLIQAGYVMITLHEEDASYEKALKAAQHPSCPDIDGFTMYIAQMVKQQINVLSK